MNEVVLLFLISAGQSSCHNNQLAVDASLASASYAYITQFAHHTRVFIKGSGVVFKREKGSSGWQHVWWCIPAVLFRFDPSGCGSPCAKKKEQLQCGGAVRRVWKLESRRHAQPPTPPRSLGQSVPRIRARVTGRVQLHGTTFGLAARVRHNRPTAP